MSDSTFDYSFVVWPAQGWELPIYEIFKAMPRQEMEFTELAWVKFVASIERSGFTLREAERRTHEDFKVVQ